MMIYDDDVNFVICFFGTIKINWENLQLRLRRNTVSNALNFL